VMIDVVDNSDQTDPEPAVTVNETILEALLDAKSMTTCEQAVFAYLRERGVVFT
jgi:hypothetical protein